MENTEKNKELIIAETKSKLEKERMILKGARNMLIAKRGEINENIKATIDESNKRIKFLENEIKNLTNGSQILNEKPLTNFGLFII